MTENTNPIEQTTEEYRSASQVIAQVVESGTGIGLTAAAVKVAFFSGSGSGDKGAQAPAPPDPKADD